MNPVNKSNQVNPVDKLNQTNCVDKLKQINQIDKFIQANPVDNNYTYVKSFLLRQSSIAFFSTLGKKGFRSTCNRAMKGSWIIWVRRNKGQIREIVISHARNFGSVPYGYIDNNYANLNKHRWQSHINMPGSVMLVTDAKLFDNDCTSLDRCYEILNCPEFYFHIHGFSIDSMKTIGHSRISLATRNGQVEAVRIVFSE